MIYECTFLHDEKDKDYIREIDAFDSDMAAKDFADYAFSNYDMWEASSVWNEDNSIVVIDPKGERKVFEITVEAEPVFYCKEIKE